MTMTWSLGINFAGWNVCKNMLKWTTGNIAKGWKSTRRRLTQAINPVRRRLAKALHNIAEAIDTDPGAAANLSVSFSVSFSVMMYHLLILRDQKVPPQS